MPDRTLRSFLWIALLLLVTFPASPQNTVGEISGFVRDTGGAVLPGVTVTVTFGDIGIERTAQTNPEGFFAFPGLPNGRADIAAELQGFQRFVRRDVKVEL